MAATKFTVVYKGKEDNFYTAELKKEMNYKTAVLVATESLPEEYEIICVIESWKLYPNKNEKTEKNNKMDDTK